MYIMYVILNYLSPQRDTLLLLSEAGRDKGSVQNEQGLLIRRMNERIGDSCFRFMRSVYRNQQPERLIVKLKA